MIKETYIIPEFAIPYLVNGDKDNLTDAEISEIERFLSDVNPNRKDVIIGNMSENTFFNWRNDIFGLIGATCYEVEIKTQ